MISTHAFTEGDPANHRRSRNWKISTHAFTEGDILCKCSTFLCKNFNSRLHGRRPLSRRFRPQDFHFNSRLHGRRPPAVTSAKSSVAISTHAFTEGDPANHRRSRNWKISTHAFTEGDILCKCSTFLCKNFNSRLHGRRPLSRRFRPQDFHFNSRLHGRRPPAVTSAKSSVAISTHAFTEGDNREG